MALARFQTTITDGRGRAIPSAQIEVRLEATGQPLASIFSDRDGATPLGNPFVSDGEGFAYFHAVGGAYQITASAEGFSRTWRYVGIGVGSESDFGLLRPLGELEEEGDLPEEGNLGTGYFIDGDFWAWTELDGWVNLGAITGPQGPRGEAGLTGPMPPTSFEFDTTTTDSDPGGGKIRLNNATLASATAAYISDTNIGGSAISDWLNTFDDSGETSFRGHLHLYSSDGPTTNFRIYKVTGSTVDGTGYRKITIAQVAGAGSFSAADEIMAAFFVRGASGSGSVSGPAGSTDNALPVFDGTDGQLLKNSTMTWDGNTFIVERTAAGGPVAVTLRRSSDPGGNFESGQLRFDGLNAATENETLGYIGTTWTDRTNGAEYAIMTLRTLINGTLAERFRLGGGFYVSGLTDPGTGKINVTELQEASARALTEAGGRTLAAGFAAVSINDGTKTTGTFTPTFLGGNIRRYINGGAHALGKPTGEGSMIIAVTNNGSAGTITTSAYENVDGDDLTTTDGDVFWFYITVINSRASLFVKAMQ